MSVSHTDLELEMVSNPNVKFDFAILPNLAGIAIELPEDEIISSLWLRACVRAR